MGREGRLRRLGPSRCSMLQWGGPEHALQGARSRRASRAWSRRARSRAGAALGAVKVCPRLRWLAEACMTSWRQPRLGVAVLAWTAACGGATQGRWHEVRFTSAALPAHNSAGVPWHSGRVDRAPSLLGGLIGLAVGYPEAGVALGSGLVADAEPEAPAPFVVVKIGADTYRTSPIGQTLAPRWVQPIAIPDRYPADARVLIQILDAVDEGVLGQRETTLGELLAPGAHILTNIGEVASLDYTVRPRTRRTPAHYLVHVSARASLASLERGHDATWFPIPVERRQHHGPRRGTDLVHRARRRASRRMAPSPAAGSCTTIPNSPRRATPRWSRCCPSSRSWSALRRRSSPSRPG